MKALIIILVLMAFLQSALLPVDLVLVMLIVRSFIISARNNLWLAFGFGLFVSLLTAQILGLHSLIYLISVILVHVAKKSQLTGSWLTVLPLVLTSSILLQLIQLLTLGQSISWTNILYQLFSTIPIYFGLKLWEERFVIPAYIRLKM